jgi:hypothetical protein
VQHFNSRLDGNVALTLMRVVHMYVMLFFFFVIVTPFAATTAVQIAPLVIW